MPRIAINWKSPITWISLASALVIGVMFGIYSNRSAQQSGAFGRKRASGPRGSGARAQRVGKPGYSIPVPVGYHVADGKHAELARKANASMVIADKLLQVPNPFYGQIMVVPMPPPRDELERQAWTGKDAAKYICDNSGDFTAKDPKFEIIQLKHDRACQLSGVSPTDPNNFNQAVIMKKPGESQAWMVYCARDRRDPGAPAACQQVIHGFRFEP